MKSKEYKVKVVDTYSLSESDSIHEWWVKTRGLDIGRSKESKATTFTNELFLSEVVKTVGRLHLGRRVQPNREVTVVEVGGIS